MENQLIALLGRHPKVLTETLYALCVRRGVPITKLLAICTSKAKQRIIDSLLHPVSGQFFRLCREYPDCFDGIHFSAECIRVAREGDGEIADISSSHQSQAYLDLIMAIVAELTSQDDTCVHGVVGGGRRTMSVHLAMVMQLLARPQDRLYHLVVDPWAAETDSDFYFPTKKSHPMTTHDGAPFDANQVSVELVEIPFLRLRSRVPSELLAIPNYKGILRWVQSDVEVTPKLLPLSIHPEDRYLSIGAIDIGLEPVELAICWLFAEISGQRADHIPHHDYRRYFAKPKADGYFSLRVSQRLWQLYQRMVNRDSLRTRFAKAFNNGRLYLEHIRPHFSNIKRKICAKFPNEDFHRWYVISAIGPRGDTCYGIRLDREFIRLPEKRLEND